MAFSSGDFSLLGGDWEDKPMGLIHYSPTEGLLVFGLTLVLSNKIMGKPRKLVALISLSLMVLLKYYL